MDTAGYVTLSRQLGLSREMQAVANNIANLSTAGFRREGVVFAEHVEALHAEGRSVAMSAPAAHVTSALQGVLQKTEGAFDLAIDGDGFFMVETPEGPALTRAGAFIRDANGELVTPDGHRLLDAGGAPVFVPPNAASVAVAPDGTLSADGAPLAQIARVTVADPASLSRADGVLFRTDAPVEPAGDGQILQGFLEEANVNPVAEIARMISVQRAYEAAQRLIDREDERIGQVLRTVTQR